MVARNHVKLRTYYQTPDFSRSLAYAYYADIAKMSQDMKWKNIGMSKRTYKNPFNRLSFRSGFRTGDKQMLQGWNYCVFLKEWLGMLQK